MQGDNNSTSDVTRLQTQQNYRWCQTATVTATLQVRLHSYRVKATLHVRAQIYIYSHTTGEVTQLQSESHTCEGTNLHLQPHYR